MAKCKGCKQEMLNKKTKSCTLKLIQQGSKWIKRNTTYFDHGKRCHDCNIVNKKGNVHHYGCDIERCPVCEDQLAFCGCFGDSITIGTG